MAADFHASLLDLDDLSLARILFFTDPKTFKCLAMTCSRLRKVSCLQASFSIQLLERKLYFYFVDGLMKMVNRDNVCHSQAIFGDFMKILDCVLGHCVKSHFALKLARSKYAKEDATLMNLLQRASRIVPECTAYERPALFEFDLPRGGCLRIVFNRSESAMEMSFRDGLISKEPMFHDVVTPNDDMSSEMAAKVDAMQLPCKYYELYDALSLSHKVLHFDENCNLKCSIGTDDRDHLLSTTATAGYENQVQQQCDLLFEDLLKTQRRVHTKKFLKLLQSYCRRLAKQSISFLMHLIVISPIYLDLMNRFTYGELLGYRSLVRYLLLKIDIRSRLRFPCQRLHIYLSDSIYLQFRGYRQHWCWDLVTAGGNAESIAQYRYDDQDCGEIEDLLSIWRPYVEHDFPEDELDSIPELSVTFVKRFFSSLLLQSYLYCY